MVDLASDRQVLRKRLRRLLGNSRQKDPTEISRVVLPALQQVGRLALIGGAIRDVARVGVKGFKSDLDFVLYDGDLADFRALMTKLDAKPNRFGGYALRYSRVKVDIWAIEDTWARRAGLRRVDRLEDLLDCTFFDWDAIIFDVQTGEIINKEDYFDLLKGEVLDVTLEQNPNPTGSLVPALRRGALWGVAFGPKLSAFSRKQLAQESWDDLVALDARAFAHPVLHRFDPTTIRRALEAETTVASKILTRPFEARPNQLPLPLRSEEIRNSANAPAKCGRVQYKLALEKQRATSIAHDHDD